jgi:putative hemolysin
MSNSATSSDNPFNINNKINITKYKTINYVIGSLLSQISGLKILSNIYQDDVALAQIEEPDQFIKRCLELLGIEYEIESGDTGSIPNKEGLVIVANHPFGGIDGLILAHLLKKVRPDVKILANGFLKKIPAVQSLFFDVDPINQKESMQKNATSLKHAVRWVKEGGCLIVFPAGEVSHLTLREHRIADPVWSKTVAKLVLLTKAPVTPIFFQGTNSIKFQLLGLIHPWIRTIMLPRELLNKVNSNIKLNIGHPVKFNKIKKLESDKLIQYLRLTTYALGSKQQKHSLEQKKITASVTNIITAVPSELLTEEIKHLPESQTLHETSKVKIMYAHAKQIPWLLQEIGRLRELTFREIGEGTGKEIDLDIYDSYYIHLFLWDKNEQRLIGAYRLGLTDKIIKQYGIKGLYSYSLFKYTNKQLIELGPSIELGRSFIRTEYQRSPSSLSLLWKGIGLFVAKHAYYRTMFGPVSISNDYQDVSRKLIVDCLRTNKLMKELSRKIKPRKPYKATTRTNWNKKELNLLNDINLASDIIAQLEQGERGIPVLIKQYIKLGGRFLEFNVDEEFNNALDGLIVVDLRETEKELLEYFMGKENTESYLSAINQLSPTLKQA